jgi:enterochelin esterase-like enzyme
MFSPGGLDFTRDVDQQLDEQLSAANIRHMFELIPGQLHTMFVWRPALYNFVQKIFTRP